MTDLTPEALAEWDADAATWSDSWSLPFSLAGIRIRTLIRALRDEKAARRGAEAARRVAHGNSLGVASERDAAEAREAALEAGINALIEAACHHCGKQPEQDGDHTCDCPNTDSECLEHTLHPMGPRLNDLRALTERDGGEPA